MKTVILVALVISAIGHIFNIIKALNDANKEKHLKQSIRRSVK